MRHTLTQPVCAGWQQVCSQPTKQFFHSSEQALTWIAPSIGIPALRFLWGDSREDRGKLFVRDLTSYMAGSIVFLSSKPLCKSIFSQFTSLKNKAEHLNFASFGAAMGIYLAFVGIATPRLSEHLTKRQKAQPAPPDLSKNSPESLPPFGGPSLFSFSTTGSANRPPTLKSPNTTQTNNRFSAHRVTNTHSSLYNQNAYHPFRL